MSDMHVGKVVNEDAQKIELDDALKEVIKKAKKNKELTKDEIKKLLEETKESVDFLNKLDEIITADTNYRVIFTDGEEQLIFDNGEFFLISTVDSLKKRKKKKKQEAKDMYLEYFIKYQLNPILEKSKKKEKIQVLNGNNLKKEKKMNKELNKSVNKNVKETKLKQKSKTKEDKER